MLSRFRDSPQLFFIYLTIFINLVGFGMVFPLLPFYAKTFNASETVIGFLAASFAIAQFLFSPFWGRLSDRFGRKPIIAISLLGTCIAFLIFALSNNLFWLFVSRFLQGVFSAAGLPVAQAYVADVTSKEDRIKGMGNLGASLALGFIFGPAIGGVLSTIDLSFPFFAASVVAFLNFLSVLIFLPESLTQRAEKLMLKEGFLNIKHMYIGLKGELGSLFILLFLWAYAISNNQVAVPLLGYEKLAVTTAQIGLFFSGMGIVSAIMQGIVVHKVVKRLGEHKTALMGLVIMASALFLMPFSVMPLMMGAFMVTVAFGSGLAGPSINSLISKETKEGQGTTMGIATAFQSCGAILAPISGGWLFSTFGYHAPFNVVAFIILLALLFVVRQKHFLRPEVSS